MSYALKAQDLDRDQFLRLISTLDESTQPDQSRRIWLECHDGWAFDYWLGLTGEINWCAAANPPRKFAASDLLSASISGRIFAPDGELRWRAIPAPNRYTLRTVFLGSSDWTRDRLEDRSCLLEDLTPHVQNAFLWGQQTSPFPGEWIELRIPHRFQYPIRGNPHRILAEVQVWTDAFGQPQFSRLCDLIPCQES